MLKPRNSMITLLTSTLPLLALLASGCARDRNIDDYNHEQVQKEIARMQAVSGTYRGVLLAKRNQTPMGAIAIAVAPDADITSANGQPATQQQASLQGNITLQTAQG